MRMRPEAMATRWVAALAPTSTMWAAPRAIEVGQACGVIGTCHGGRYHNHMRVLAFALRLAAAALVALAPRAWSQSGAARPGQRGRRSRFRRRWSGASARASCARSAARSPATSTIPEVAEYLGDARRAPVPGHAAARQDFEFFGVRDPTDQRLRAARRLRRRAHRADHRGRHRVGARLGARARDLARHAAPHRAHARPAAADADAGAGGASPRRSCSAARGPTSPAARRVAAQGAAASRRSSPTRATSSARPTASACSAWRPPASTRARWPVFFEKMQRAQRASATTARCRATCAPTR